MIEEGIVNLVGVVTSGGKRKLGASISNDKSLTVHKDRGGADLGRDLQ